MSNAAVLNKPDLSESSQQAKNVREQLRALEAALRSLSSDVADAAPVAVGRLDRARLNVTRAVDELLCTESSQLPF
jgi:hypothetical protein